MITTIEQIEKALEKTNKVSNKAQKVLKWFLAYLAFIGIFGFALFIAQEGICTICWANFSAMDTNRYDLVKTNYETIESVNNVFKVINKWAMWVSPFQQWGYRAYSRSITQYTETMKAMCIARDPGLYVGEQVTINFKYKTATRQSDHTVWLSNNKIIVLTCEMPNKNPVQITGLMATGKNNKFVITADCPPAT